MNGSFEARVETATRQGRVAHNRSALREKLRLIVERPAEASYQDPDVGGASPEENCTSLMSVYDSKPSAFLIRLDVKPGDKPRLDLSCVGFDGSVWRGTEFANYLISWLPDYALDNDQLKQFSHANGWAKMREAAARIYTTKNADKRGEIGEISLHAVCREHFGTVPLVPRVFYLSSANEVVKGFDLVHYRIPPGDGQIEIWLSAVDLRRLSSLGMDTLASLKEAVAAQLAKSRSSLLWSGYADYENLLALATIVCAVRSPSEFGAASAAQLERFIRKLRMPMTFKAFFEDYATSNKGYETRFENIFKFLRACEYSLPEYFTAIEKFVKLALPPYAGQVDYTLLIGEMTRWFRPEPLKALEEQGVPIQISERYLRNGDTVDRLAARLRETAGASDGHLSALERDWILGALPIPHPSGGRDPG